MRKSVSHTDRFLYTTALLRFMCIRWYYFSIAQPMDGTWTRRNGLMIADSFGGLEDMLLHDRHGFFFWLGSFECLHTDCFGVERSGSFEGLDCLRG